MYLPAKRGNEIYINFYTRRSDVPPPPSISLISRLIPTRRLRRLIPALSTFSTKKKELKGLLAAPLLFSLPPRLYRFYREEIKRYLSTN